ncbi:suppressor of fused domain protein [Burkholderia orbicola]|uniref:suppressor of fused domain protein n=2 Tax=Burkholderia TaxID=32008 RepID=UPI002FE28A54
MTISDRDMTKGPISADRKAVGRHALSVFGGKPKVQEYLHDDLPMAVDVLSVVDSPEPDLVSYSTIGLFETVLGNEAELGTRVELCGAMPADIEQWPNVLASAVFALMRSRRAVMPGSVLEGYVAEYYSDTLVPHLYLTAPFLWSEGHFKQLELNGGVKVNWLQGMPISEAELEILRARGESEFEDLLEQADVDVFDLYRASM